MTKAAFDKIAEGLTEALEIARGAAEPRQLYVPPEIDVRAIRAKAGMTQDSFASAFGFTVHQIRQWEQGRSRPLGAMRAYLMLIERDPHAILKFLHGANGRRKGEGRSAA
ncbi:MAG: helix-turn-helix domain-containing protein [Acetobacteraceae bacterium]